MITNLQQRTITGLLFGSIVIACCWQGGWMLWSMLASILIMCLYEWTQIAFRLQNKTANIPMPFIISFIGLILYFIADFFDQNIPISLLIGIYSLVLGYFLIHLSRYRQLETSLVFNIFLGFCWFLIPIICANRLDKSCLWLIPYLWCSDTGAYFIGKYFGKMTLLPSVSPKKTIEGLFGGFITCLLYSAFLLHFGIINSSIIGVCLACLAAFVGTLGDLSESLVKRQSGIKDSSHFLPGHGGFLDRFDSFLFFIPAAYFTLKYFGLA